MGRIILLGCVNKTKDKNKKETAWMIGKGLLQKTVYYISRSKSKCPTNKEVIWTRTGANEPTEKVVKCAYSWKAWSEWTPCLEVCTKGGQISKRVKICEEVNIESQNIEKCSEQDSEGRACECSDLENIIKNDHHCCRKNVFSGITMNLC
jgi:hypothetical protein